jgi:hypothetical protein
MQQKGIRRCHRFQAADRCIRVAAGIVGQDGIFVEDGPLRVDPKKIFFATCTASSTSSTEAKATLAVTSPVAGLVMSPVRPLFPAAGLLPM